MILLILLLLWHSVAAVYYYSVIFSSVDVYFVQSVIFCYILKRKLRLFVPLLLRLHLGWVDCWTLSDVAPSWELRTYIIHVSVLVAEDKFVARWCENQLRPRYYVIVSVLHAWLTSSRLLRTDRRWSLATSLHFRYCCLILYVGMSSKWMIMSWSFLSRTAKAARCSGY